VQFIIPCPDLASKGRIITTVVETNKAMKSLVFWAVAQRWRVAGAYVSGTLLIPSSQFE